jgi:hypothetical protein
MRLVRQTRLSIGGPASATNRAGGALVGPEGDFDDMVRLAEELLADAKAFKDLDGATLHAVRLAHLHGAVAALEDVALEPAAGKPGRGAEAGRATAADDDVGSGHLA